MTFSRFHVTYFECRPYRASGSLQCVDFNSLHNQETNGKEEKTSFSFVMDFVSVTINIIITCIIPLPMLLICLLSELYG